jgi:preprotein translocase subunit SecA
MVARLAYPFVAARRLAEAQPDELTDRVLEHLDEAESVFQSTVGAAEIRRRAAVPLTEIEPQLKSGLQRVLGNSTYAQVESAGSLGSLPTAVHDEVAQAIGRLSMSENFRGLILGVGDRLWVDYLTEMEGLRTSIGLEAYGQRDPLVQYKSRAFDMFQNLLTEIRSGVASRLFRAQQAAPPQASVTMPRPPADEALPDREAPSSQPSDVSSKKKHRRRH